MWEIGDNREQPESLGSARTSISRIGRAVGALSIGTVLVQATSMFSQVIFAVWLTPTDFGYWATATSMMVVSGGLVNLGEVNGYLANQSHSYWQARNAIWRVNMLLVALGVVLAVAIARTESRETVVLVIMLALNIPITGYGLLLIAVFMRNEGTRRIVSAQAWSAVLRTLVGAGVAWSMHSAYAFGLATLSYSLSIVVLLGWSLRGKETKRSTVIRRIKGLDRARWAIFSLAQYLPSQVDYLVLAIVSTPEVLGVYFLAFQVTVGISSLVAGPLTKSTLSSLAKLSERDQRAVFMALSKVALGLVVVLSAVACGFCLAVSAFISGPWADVPVIASILLASLPARFVNPLADARLMASNRWSIGTLMCAVDAVGTGVAALSVVLFSLEGLAIAIVLWKVVFSCFKLWTVCNGAFADWARIVVVLVISTASMVAAHWLPGAGRYICVIAAMGLGVYLVVATRGRRSNKQRSSNQEW